MPSTTLGLGFADLPILLGFSVIQVHESESEGPVMVTPLLLEPTTHS
jgi:hypothetical protein